MSKKNDKADETIWLLRIENLKKRYLSGDLYAFLSGVALCQQFNKPLPVWLSDAVLEEFPRVIDGDIRGKRGPGNKLLGSDETRARDIVRSNAVWGYLRADCLDQRRDLIKEWREIVSDMSSEASK